MYSPTHSSVAIGILILPIPFWISVPVAILSHAFVDMLGEGFQKYWVRNAIIVHSILLLVGVLSNFTNIVALGIICGNLFDILDKLILKPLLDKIFKQGWEPIHSCRIYPKVLINLDEKSTLLFDLYTFLIVLLAMVVGYKL